MRPIFSNWFFIQRFRLSFGSVGIQVETELTDILKYHSRSLEIYLEHPRNYCWSVFDRQCIAAKSYLLQTRYHTDISLYVNNRMNFVSFWSVLDTIVCRWFLLIHSWIQLSITVVNSFHVWTFRPKIHLMISSSVRVNSIKHGLSSNTIRSSHIRL